MDIPEQYSRLWLLPRPARIALRRGKGYDVKPEFEPADGAIVHVHRPRMKEAEDWGLYVGEVMWKLVQYADHLPIELSEHDFEFVPAEAMQKGPLHDGRKGDDDGRLA